MAIEIGDLDVIGWKEAHPDERVPALIFDADSSKIKNTSLLREIAENEKRRSYTTAEVKSLAERLKKAGFADIKGRPIDDQQSVRVELARILGRSSRQIRRLLNDPEVPTKRKGGHDVRLSRLKRLGKSLAKVQKDLTMMDDTGQIAKTVDSLAKLVADYLE